MALPYFLATKHFLSLIELPLQLDDTNIPFLQRHPHDVHIMDIILESGQFTKQRSDNSITVVCTFKHRRYRISWILLAGLSIGQNWLAGYLCRVAVHEASRLTNALSEQIVEWPVGHFVSNIGPIVTPYQATTPTSFILLGRKHVMGPQRRLIHMMLSNQE